MAKPAQKYLLTAAVFLSLIFIGLTWFYAVAPTVSRVETMITRIIQPGAAPVLTKIFLFITYMASWPTVVIFGIVAVIFLVRRGQRYQAGFFIAAIILAEALAILTKILARRPRPLSPASVTAFGYGFPSGHALVGLVFYGLIIYFLFKILKKQWTRWLMVALGVILIVLIGFSRLYLAVHWPGDVLGGWIAGGAILMLFSVLNSAFTRH